MPIANVVRVRLPLRGASVRAHLLALIFVAALPMVLFSIVAVELFTRQQRAAVERGGLETARALVSVVDRELGGYASALHALSTSPTLDRGDLSGFRAAAVRVLEGQPGWLTISLATPSGRQLVNLQRPRNARLPTDPEMESLAAVSATGRAQVGAFFVDPATREPAFAVRVPVKRQGAVRYVLTAMAKPNVMGDILARQRLPEGWIGAILDQHHIHVARTHAPEQVGHPPAPELVDALASSSEGWRNGRSVEDIDIYRAFSRSAWTGWSVALGVPRAVVDGPVFRSGVALAIGAALCLLVGVGLALVFGRRISRSLRGLALAAPALERGAAPPASVRSVVREVDDLTRALHQAGIERRLAEESLRVTLASIGDGVIATDTAGRVTFMNAVAESLTGWRLEEVRGQSLPAVLRLINEDTREPVENPVDRVADQGDLAAASEPIVLIARDGFERPIDESAAPIEDDSGTLRGVVLVFHDVTERRRTERRLAFVAEAGALLASSLDYEATLERVSRLAVPRLGDMCAVDLVDETGEVQRVAVTHADPQKEQVAREMRRRHGFRRDTAISRVLATGRPEFFSDVSEGLLARSATTSEQLDMLRSLDIASAIIVPLVARGRTLGAITLTAGRARPRYTEHEMALAEDLAARAALAIDNARLYRSQETRADRLRVLAQMNELVSSSLDMPRVLEGIARAAADLMQVPSVSFWIADEDARVLRLGAFSSGLLRSDFPRESFTFDESTLGWIARERQALNIPDVSQDPRVVTPAWFKAHGLTSFYGVPIVWQRSLLAVLSLNGRGPIRLTRDDEDLLEIFAAQAAVAIRNAELYREAARGRSEAEAANRAKDEFLATLSHELRTPLNAILGWARMLRSAPLDPRQVTRALETIERNTWMQAQLIDDLLDVSRIIAGKLRLEKRATNLVTIIEAAVESLRRDAEAKQLAVDVRLDRAADLVFGDPVRLQQIMVNLLGNAVKFTPDGGRITLRLERVEASARIVVTDTGCGIDPDALPHIFERFRQEDSTIARGHTGLGLGLAIVRHLVELHGGTITARSDGRGRGATFTVDLPILAVKLPAVDAAGAPEAPTLEVVAGEPASPDSTRRLEGVQALVVDDHPDARELVAMVLKQFGAEVETAGSATDALAALESTRFDVLVSDLGMPLADGFELIRRLRASERAHGRRVLPAIALTAYTAPEDRERALAAGFNAHAAKPIDPAELIEIVAKIARRIAAA